MMSEKLSFAAASAGCSSWMPFSLPVGLWTNRFLKFPGPLAPFSACRMASASVMLRASVTYMMKPECEPFR
ncbi:hypothetical protein D3C86_1676100 [compost metagenome]